jgi:hypothetical protein
MHEHYASPQATQVQYDFSMHHYNKSIRKALRTTEPDEAFDSLLLTSVMFSALEGLKGEFEQSLQHALSGIKILAKGRSSDSISSPAIPDEVLPKIFLALQTQAMEVEDHSIFLSYPDVAQRFPPLPAQFEDVDQAMRYLQIIINQLISFGDRFQDAYRGIIYVPPAVPPHLVSEFTALRDCFSRWNGAVGHIQTLVAGADGDEHKAFFLIKIYQSVLDIVFKSLDENVLSFDIFEPEVSGMLKLIEIFLESQSGWTKTSLEIQPVDANRIYSVSLGVVPILFEIAHQSRIPQLRSEALRLLRSCNRREGVWDSTVASRIAERLNTLQEEVDATFSADETHHCVVITDIGLLTDGEIPFQYMVVQADSMMQSFWFSSFNPPPDMPKFDCRA